MGVVVSLSQERRKREDSIEGKAAALALAAARSLGFARWQDVKAELRLPSPPHKEQSDE